MQALPRMARAVSVEPRRLCLSRRVDPGMARPGRAGASDRRRRVGRRCGGAT